MKKVLSIIFLFLLISCNRNDNELYWNINCRIANYNEEKGTSMDKFHRPMVYKTWLVQSLLDTTLFAEWRVNNDSSWYNHKIGDTIHFDYLRKARFFKIK